MGCFQVGLEGLSLDEVVCAAQRHPSDDTLAMAEVLRRFKPKARSIAIGLTDLHHLHEDLSQAALLGMVKAVRRHRAGRTGFARYAVLYMTGAAKRELRQWIGTPTLSLSAPETAVAATTMAMPEAVVGQLSWGFGRAAEAVLTLPERQRDLLTSRHIVGNSLAIIAADGGTSVPAVSQRLATAHRAVATLLAA